MKLKPVKVTFDDIMTVAATIIAIIIGVIVGVILAHLLFALYRV